MANEGFKGNVVTLSQLTITAGPTGAATVGVSVHFSSEEGTVHAVANHNFLVDRETNTDGMAAALAELIRLATKKVEAIHYARPNDQESSPLVGIAEALRGRAGVPDEPGTQG